MNRVQINNSKWTPTDSLWPPVPPEPITEKRWSLQGLGVFRSSSRIRIGSSLDFREIFGPGRLPRQWRIMTKPCTCAEVVELADTPSKSLKFRLFSNFQAISQVAIESATYRHR